MRQPTTWAEATLDDIVITVAPTEELYGYDHAPSIPSEPVDVAARYSQVAAELEDKFKMLDPLATLAALAVLQTMSKMGSETLFLDAPDLEFAQAAFLRTGGGIVKPLLPEITCLCNKLRFFRALLLHGKKHDPNTKEWSLHQRRQESLNVRHTHFGPTARHLAKMITEGFGSRWSTQLGFSLSQASSVLFGAADVVIESMTGKSAAAVIAKWANESLLGVIADSTWEMLIAIFEIRAQILSERSGAVKVDQIEKILNIASLSYGQIENAEIGYLLLDNSVWSAPMFKTQSNRHYLFCPALMSSFNDYQMTRILGSVAENPDHELGGVRGDILEIELTQSLGRLFPSARILKSVKWTDSTSGIEYETDAIVWLDDLMLVFEAKGNIINPAGRRGSHTYFKSFDYAVVNATLQSHRLKKNIYRSSSSFELRPDDGAKERIAVLASGITHVVCFGVTLERFASASYEADKGVWDRVRRSGSEPMPILTIGDLHIIEELLKAEYERVHYLIRRTEIPHEFDFVADELDLITLYLKSGFVVAEEWRRKKSILYLYGLSDFLRFYTKLSPYYDRRMSVPRRLASEWKAELDRIWTKRSQKRISICYDLLNVPLHQQSRFISDVRKCGEKMRRKRKGDQMDGVLIELLDQHNPSVLVCLVHDGRSKLEFPGCILKLADNVRQTYADARIVVFRFISDLRNGYPMFAAYLGVDRRKPGSAAKDGET